MQCDGQTPCMQCRNRRSTCAYSIRTEHQSKSNLHQEAGSLRQSLQDSDDIITALRYSSYSTQVVDGLQNGQTNRQILETLGALACNSRIAALDTIVEVPGGTPEQNGEWNGEWNGGWSDTLGAAGHGASLNMTGVAGMGSDWYDSPETETVQSISPEATHLPEHAMLMSNDLYLCLSGVPESEEYLT